LSRLSIPDLEARAPGQAVAAIEEVLGSIGDTCPEYPPHAG